ncbi:hypothetical protein ACLB2K_012605 [Fragaria x ananassa]
MRERKESLHPCPAASHITIVGRVSIYPMWVWCEIGLFDPRLVQVGEIAVRVCSVRMGEITVVGGFRFVPRRLDLQRGGVRASAWGFLQSDMVAVSPKDFGWVYRIRSGSLLPNREWRIQWLGPNHTSLISGVSLRSNSGWISGRGKAYGGCSDGGTPMTGNPRRWRYVEQERKDLGRALLGGCASRCPWLCVNVGCAPKEGNFICKGSHLETVGSTSKSGPQVYPRPGAIKVRLRGAVPKEFCCKLPTLISKEENDLEGLIAHASRRPPRQQPTDMFSGEESGMRSSISGSFTQECNVSDLKDEQFPCLVAKAPFIDQITSSCAHIHPSFQPGMSNRIEINRSCSTMRQTCYAICLYKQENV